MTNPPLPPLPRTPNTAARRARSRIAAIALAGAVLPMLGCPKPPPPPPAPPPPPPPAPKAPEPEPVTTDTLLQDMGADARVQFPQSKAPTDENLARAAISLADAIVRGDSNKLRPMLSVPARAVLEQLSSTGGWDEATSKLDAARIIYAGSSPIGGGTMTVLAIQDADGAYLLGWTGARSGSNWVFSNIPTSGEVKARASEWDSVPLISLWADTGEIGLDDAAMDAAQDMLDEIKKQLEQQNPDQQPPDEGPTRKSTPAGPITIPKPGGA